MADQSALTVPEQIATSKRKFYKALDAITSRASLQTTSKRPQNATEAFAETIERVKKRPRLDASTSLDTFEFPAKPQGPRRAYGTTNDTWGNPLPKFSPWSHDMFLARLKSFSSVSLWHPKPDSIGEVEWAKRGWECVDVNTVACRGGCEKRVLVDTKNYTKLPDDNVIPEAEGTNRASEEQDDEDNEENAVVLERSMIEQYRGAIVAGHKSSCPWYQAGCKDDIYRLPVVRPALWQSDLRKRYESLLATAPSIITIRVKEPLSDDPVFESSRSLLGDLVEILGSREMDKDCGQKALRIAMHGWGGSSESGTSLLQCDACFQRIGLWMYQPYYRPPHRTEGGEIENAGEPTTVDLLEMHRDHCPWRNAETQCARDSLHGLNACQILARMVANAARDHRRRSREQAGIDVVAEEEAQIESSKTPPVIRSREEIARKDQELESRIRKLKTLFTFKRKSKQLPKPRA